MSEFGHFGAIGAGVCIDCWGAGPYVIKVGKTDYRFEDSDRFGPTLINLDWSEKSKQPGQKSPFWDAHAAWVVQGRRVENDGVTCIWEKFRPTTFKRSGRRAIIVEAGDDRGQFVEIQEP